MRVAQTCRSLACCMRRRLVPTVLCCGARDCLVQDTLSEQEQETKGRGAGGVGGGEGGLMQGDYQVEWFGPLEPSLRLLTSSSCPCSPSLVVCVTVMPFTGGARPRTTRLSSRNAPEGAWLNSASTSGRARRTHSLSQCAPCCSPGVHSEWHTVRFCGETCACGHCDLQHASQATQQAQQMQPHMHSSGWRRGPAGRLSAAPAEHPETLWTLIWYEARSLVHDAC